MTRRVTCDEHLRRTRSGRRRGDIAELLLQLLHDPRHVQPAVECIGVVINFHPLELRDMRSRDARGSLDVMCMATCVQTPPSSYVNSRALLPET